mmetsp:Transcript_15598/g.24254  ORF Transcript_15598/g.24254 Transcript_15598/m.24254 type:complete len:127 (-) Transcript_15598:182-562(-)
MDPSQPYTDRMICGGPDQTLPPHVPSREFQNESHASTSEHRGVLAKPRITLLHSERSCPTRYVHTMDRCADCVEVQVHRGTTSKSSLAQSAQRSMVPRTIYVDLRIFYRDCWLALSYSPLLLAIAL